MNPRPNRRASLGKDLAMSTNVSVAFRFAVKITPTSGNPAWSAMTPQQKVAAKEELLAPVEQGDVEQVVAGWSAVTIATDSCCEISDIVLRVAVQAKLDLSATALTGALGFMPTLDAAAPNVVCVNDPNTQKHICTRGFKLLKGIGGAAWTETSATYELTAPIQLVAQWTTPSE
jgi:hypothetical protein